MELIDILGLTLDQHTDIGVPQAEHDKRAALMQLQAGRTTDLVSVDALLDRLTEYIHVQTLEGFATTLGDLNRRFHRPARTLGKSLRDCCSELISQDLIQSIEYAGRSGYVSTSVYKDMRIVDADAERNEQDTNRVYLRVRK